MKQILGLAILLTLIVSCGGNSNTANTTPSSNTVTAPAPTTESKPTPPTQDSVTNETSQEPERLDMAKEGPSIVWEEKVAANSSKAFVFYAKKGQKLTLGFIDDTKQGSMDLGKMSIEPNAEPTEMTIDVSKDYRLSVSNNSDKATSFRISLSLTDAKK